MLVFEIEVHSPCSHEELEKRDLQVLWNEMTVETTSLVGPEEQEGSFA